MSVSSGAEQAPGSVVDEASLGCQKCRKAVTSVIQDSESEQSSVPVKKTRLGKIYMPWSSFYILTCLLGSRHLVASSEASSSARPKASSSRTLVLRSKSPKFDSVLDPIDLAPASVNVLEQILKEFEDRTARQRLIVSLETQMLRVIEGETSSVRKTLSMVKARGGDLKGKGKAE